MKTYFLTVDTVEDALSIDTNAQVVKVLPPMLVTHTYCCREQDTFFSNERYVCKINTFLSRKEIKKRKGVVRLRTKMLEHYQTSTYRQIC
jgi:hypothetical protein